MFEALIKAQLKMLGLDEGLWNKVTVEMEADVPQAVLKFAVERGVKSEADRRVKQAVETNTEKLRKEFDTEKAEQLKNAQQGQQTPGTGDEGAVKGNEQTGTQQNQGDLVAAITEAMKPITERLGALEQVRVTETRDTKVRAALKAAELPDSVANHIHVENDDQIEAAVKQFRDDFPDVRRIVDPFPDSTGVPRGDAGSSASESAATNWAQQKNSTAPGKNDAVFPTAVIPGITDKEHA